MLKLSLCCILTCFFSFLLNACVNNTTTQPTQPSPQIHTTTRQASPTFSDDNYANIDQHALAAPASLTNDLPRLVAYLVKPARNNREKARAIYRWITHNIAFNAPLYFHGQTRNVNFNMEMLLHQKVALCDGYVNLFQRLGQLAGLEVVKISGYSKGFSYKNTSKINQISHAWNAVKIDGQWELVDTAWGAGYLDAKQKRFVRDFESHYFLTPPKEFIFDHFPFDAKWQLLSSPVDKAAFINFVYLRPAFFRNKLKLVSHKQVHVSTSQRDLTLEFDVPPKTYMSGMLFRNKKLLDRGLVKLGRENGRYLVKVELPEAGEYVLLLFSKKGISTQHFEWSLHYQISAI